MCHLAAIVLAVALDWLIGDPEKWPHPVKGFGRLIGLLDRRLNNGRFRKLKGVLLVLTVVLAAFGSSCLLMVLSYQWHPVAGVALEAVLISTTIAQNNLAEAVMRVYHLLEAANLPEARTKLSYIVGRETNRLPEPEIVRGAVETVAENTSDGITAPLFWSVIGGAPLALMYRAVNTCDSMVGYRNETYGKFGWASARLDDVLNWIPARLTGFLMMVVQKPAMTSFHGAWSVLFRDARKHKSPNAGWVEAAVAALLGVRLGGTNVYHGMTSVSQRLGDPHQPLTSAHILQTITIMRRTVFFFLLCMLIGGITIELATTWGECPSSL
ncbi:adenosylcobinamide-phosphate synthase CbiB [Virgibacillus ihumii]|uniref:adenosylcobinamide-phosphate synthase CbiB n=1 Tax=Virgibacillus ihumii TaxID=2686091 RepID=UPI00157C7EAF|nr:adenosylcobinamide-phosphate synthase CbiB [Virgibacillus ihumii]